MSSDDLTQKLQDGEEKTTQPTITAVFRLLQAVKLDLENVSVRLGETNSRLDATDVRLGKMELQLSRDLTGVGARLSDKMENGFAELGDKIDALNRGRLHTDAEQSNLLRRIHELESKAS